MAERGKFWTAAETKLLIDTWSHDNFQKQLHGAKWNDNVFGQIMNTLAKRGYHRTAQQCCAKIKSLKRRYKEIADRLRKSGEGRESDADNVPADFPFFEDIDAVMGGRASVSPVHLLDSASGDTQPQTGFQQGEVDTPKKSCSRPSTPQSTSRPDTPTPLTGRIKLDTLPGTLVTSVPETPAGEIPDSPGSSTSRTATDIHGSSSSRTATDIHGSSSSRTVTDIHGSSSSRTVTDIAGPSTQPDANTPSTSAGKGAYEPKKKRRRKLTKLEKAEASADTLVTKVLADQAKRREESAEIEKRRLELATQTAERKAERDRQFMQQMQQMMALMVQSIGAQSYPPPTPFPMGYQPGPGYPLSGQPGPGYPLSGQPGPGYPPSGQPGPGYPPSGQPGPGYPPSGQLQPGPGFYPFMPIPPAITNPPPGDQSSPDDDSDH